MCGMSYRQRGEDRHDVHSILSVASRQKRILRSETASSTIVEVRMARLQRWNAAWINSTAAPVGRASQHREGTMKAIVVTDRGAGTAGMRLVGRPEPQGASLATLSGADYGDVVVQVHASGFTGDELSWPSTWIDRLGRDRTPSIPGHEVAGVVTALSYGTTGLSVGQRVFGLTDWTRDGTLAEYVAVEARNLAPLPGDVDFTVGAALVMPGLTAWQGLFEHGRLRAGQSVLVHGSAAVSYTHL